MPNTSIYIGVFLDKESKELLHKLSSFVPEGWKWYGEHMTIKFIGKPTLPEDFPSPYDKLATEHKNVTLTVTHIGISDKAVAVRVDGVESINKNPHITLAIPEGGKPVNSNLITAWKPIDNFTITGVIAGDGDAKNMIDEMDLTSDTVIPSYRNDDNELDGKDYLETVWSAPTMHTSFGGITESTIKNATKKLLTEETIRDLKTMFDDNYLGWITVDDQFIPNFSHLAYLRKIYPSDPSINAYTEEHIDNLYRKAQKDGLIRVDYQIIDKVPTLSMEGANKDRVVHIIENIYYPYLSTKRSRIFIDINGNHKTFELPQNKEEIERFIWGGDTLNEVKTNFLNEGNIKKLIKEVVTTFPYNVGSAEATYDSWSDHPGDRNKVDLNEIEYTDISKLPFLNAIEKIGGRCYQVGGSVRDNLLGKESKDLDIMVSGVTPEDLLQALKPYGTANLVGQSFGVIKFKPTGAREDIDIALARTDNKKDIGHKGIEVITDPSISVEQDMQRRDITINAIAKDIHGNIIDPFGGVNDIKNKIIRMVSPEAFAEDPLRMIRAIGQSARFNFTIEPKTMSVIQQNAADIKTISAERILEELSKIVNKGNIKIGSELLVESKLYENIFGVPFQGSFEDFPKVKKLSEFIYLLIKDSISNPSEYFKKHLRGDINGYKEIKAFELTKNDIQTPADERWLLNKVHTIAPEAIGSFIVQDKIKDISKHPEEKYPRVAPKIDISSDEIQAMGIKNQFYGMLNHDLLDLIYKDKLPNDKKAIMSYIKDNIDKYVPNTIQKIQEITTKLLKEVDLDELKTYRSGQIKPAPFYVTPSKDYAHSFAKHMSRDNPYELDVDVGKVLDLSSETSNYLKPDVIKMFINYGVAFTDEEIKKLSDPRIVTLDGCPLYCYLNLCYEYSNAALRAGYDSIKLSERVPRSRKWHTAYLILRHNKPPKKIENSTRQKIQEITEKILYDGIDVYAFQDTHAERIISKSWNGEGGNVWRYRFENAGDILRELAKYKNTFLDPTYIYEKINKIEKFIPRYIKDDVHPSDQYRTLKKENAENLKELRQAYEIQPVITDAQKVALQLIFNLIDGKLGEAQKQIDYFNQFRGHRYELMAANKYPNQNPADFVPPKIEYMDEQRNITKGILNKLTKQLLTEGLNKAKLILPIGISGSGKSRWIQSLSKDQYVIISPDEIRKELTGSISDQTKNKEVFSQVDARLDNALQQNKWVILDATNINTKFRREFIIKIKSKFPDLEINYKLFDADPELSKSRIKADIANGKDRSNVPDDVIDRQAQMYKQSVEDISSEDMTPLNESIISESTIRKPKDFHITIENIDYENHQWTGYGQIKIPYKSWKSINRGTRPMVFTWDTGRGAYRVDIREYLARPKPTKNIVQEIAIHPTPETSDMFNQLVEEFKRRIPALKKYNQFVDVNSAKFQLSKNYGKTKMYWNDETVMLKDIAVFSELLYHTVISTGISGIILILLIQFILAFPMIIKTR